MKGNFFALENEIFEYGLNVYEFVVYAYLRMRADRNTNSCFPTASTIARDCNISESQVRKVTASLEKKRLLTKKMQFKRTVKGKNHQTSNRYHIEPLPVQSKDTPSISDTHSMSDIEGK